MSSKPNLRYVSWDMLRKHPDGKVFMCENEKCGKHNLYVYPSPPNP